MAIRLHLWLILLFIGLTGMAFAVDVCLAQTPIAADSLAMDLRDGFKRSLNSYQRSLWYAYHSVTGALDDKEWIRIRPSLEAQKFHIEDMGSAGSSRRYEITLDGLAYQPRSGPTHPLIIDLEVSPRISRTAPTTMTIHIVRVGLRAAFHKPFATVVDLSPYPKGSVLDAFLKLPELKDIATQNPLLETVELDYHPPMFMLGIDATNLYEPYGYLMSAELVREQSGHVYTKYPVYEAPSGLDPRKTQDGTKAKPVDFPSGDTFGKIVPFSMGGEGESGPAMGSVIHWGNRDQRPLERPRDLHTANSIADLRAFPANITALKLEGTHITNTDIAAIARFKGLIYLDMSQCEGDPNEPIGESALRIISNLEKLQCLKLNGGSVTDRLCGTISLLQHLNSLTILQGSITDAGMRRLATLPRLETLEVPYCGRLTNASLQTIGAMTRLRRLNILSSGDYSDTGLRKLGGLKQLRELTIGTLPHVTVRGFAFLPRLLGLTYLCLGYMPLNDAALGYISPLKQLTTLDLIALSRITDAGLLKLRTLDHIGWLGIQFCPRVTPTGINRLREALRAGMGRSVGELGDGGVSNLSP
jgi:hypothetical protein